MHNQSLARFGGASGIRDEGLLDSALARPLNRHLYEPESPLADLAATQDEATQTIRLLASGELSEAALTQWIAAHMVTR